MNHDTFVAVLTATFWAAVFTTFGTAAVWGAYELGARLSMIPFRSVTQAMLVVAIASFATGAHYLTVTDTQPSNAYDWEDTD